jgi:hypothetical protein
VSRHTRTTLQVGLQHVPPDVTLNRSYDNTASDVLLHVTGDSWTFAVHGSAAEIRGLARALAAVTLELDDDQAVRAAVDELGAAQRVGEPEIEGVGV